MLSPEESSLSFLRHELAISPTPKSKIPITNSSFFLTAHAFICKGNSFFVLSQIVLSSFQMQLYAFLLFAPNTISQDTLNLVLEPASEIGKYCVILL